MFEAKFQAANVLKKLVDAIKDLVVNANWECSPSGIMMQAMDSSHVSLISMQLNKDGFADYRCDKNLTIGLNLAHLAKILKCANDKDSVTMSTTEDGDTVSFLFESEGRSATFELKMMDIDAEHLGIPETEYKCKVAMNGGEFSRITKDLSQFGDACTISVVKKSISFTVKGDMGTAKIVREKNQVKSEDDSDKKKSTDELSIDMEEETELLFALRYLNNITKATPLSDQVHLNLSRDVPLMVEYKIENLGSLQYFLAPKIEDEAEAE